MRRDCDCRTTRRDSLASNCDSRLWITRKWSAINSIDNRGLRDGSCLTGGLTAVSIWLLCRVTGDNVVVWPATLISPSEADDGKANVWLLMTTGGPPGVMVAVAVVSPMEGLPVQVTLSIV